MAYYGVDIREGKLGMKKMSGKVEVRKARVPKKQKVPEQVVSARVKRPGVTVDVNTLAGYVVEVVVVHGGERVRVLCDANGISVGTPVAD